MLAACEVPLVKGCVLHTHSCIRWFKWFYIP